MKQVCREAAEHDRADTVVLGCLGMAQYGGEVERDCGVKVIDPAFLAVAWAELSTRLDLRPSRRSATPFGGL